MRLDALDPANRRRSSWTLTDATSFDGLADALRDIVAGAEHPLAAAAGASAAAMKLLTDAPPVDVEIFALWLSDLALAQRLGGTRRFRCSPRRSRMRRCVAARAASVRVPAIRIGRTPRPALTRWPPRRLTLSPVSCRALAKSFSPPSPNCAPRAPGGSSNFCLATTPCRRRAPRRRRVYPIAPRVACSIGSSSLAPCANSPAGRIFGSMAVAFSAKWNGSREENA